MEMLCVMAFIWKPKILQIDLKRMTTTSNGKSSPNWVESMNCLTSWKVLGTQLGTWELGFEILECQRQTTRTTWKGTGICLFYWGLSGFLMLIISNVTKLFPTLSLGKDSEGDWERQEASQERAASHKGPETVARLALQCSGGFTGMREKRHVRGQLPWSVRNGSQKIAREKLQQFEYTFDLRSL